MNADDSFPIARLKPLLASLNQNEVDFIASLFEPVWLKKHEFFIKTGDPVTKVAFVAEGKLCRYSYHEKGQKIIDKWLFENDFFTDRKGYFLHQPSFNNIQALDPCLLWTISVEEIEVLKKSSYKYREIIDSIIIQTLNINEDNKDMCLIDDPLEKILCCYDRFGPRLPEINKRDLPRYLHISTAAYYLALHKRNKNVHFWTLF